MSELPPDSSHLNLQNDRAEDVKIIFSEDGIVKAKLQAKEFIRNDHSDPPYADFNDGIKVEFFNQDQQVESTLTARTARFYTEEKNVVVRDSVVVVNKKGEMLQTEELVWNQKVERFFSEKPVRITIGNQVSYGEGIEANQDFSWYRIGRQRGSVPVEAQDLP